MIDCRQNNDMEKLLKINKILFEMSILENMFITTYDIFVLFCLKK